MPIVLGNDFVIADFYSADLSNTVAHYRRLHLRMGFELPSLAFKAMAHGDTNRIALACEPQVSAAACGFVVCHSSCPLP